MPARDTREAIRQAATSLFATNGYANTSVRDIAAGASVDPALVIRHFGSKEALFIRTMDDALPEATPLDGPLEQVGESFIRFVISSDAHVRGVFLALLRASDADGISSHLKAVHDEYFVAPLRARLSGDDADVRARLAAALVGGLLYSLWVVGDDELAAADQESLVRTYGALLQRLVTPELPGGR
jgi:AcrR family transcriptional regulator